MEKKSASVFGKYEFNKNKTKQKPGKLFSMGKPKILPGKYYLSRECGPSHTLESPGRMNKRRSPLDLRFNWPTRGPN